MRFLRPGKTFLQCCCHYPPPPCPLALCTAHSGGGGGATSRGGCQQPSRNRPGANQAVPPWRRNDARIFSVTSVICSLWYNQYRPCRPPAPPQQSQHRRQCSDGSSHPPHASGLKGGGATCLLHAAISPQHFLVVLLATCHGLLSQTSWRKDVACLRRVTPILLIASSIPTLSAIVVIQGSDHGVQIPCVMHALRPTARLISLGHAPGRGLPSPSSPQLIYSGILFRGGSWIHGVPYAVW
jgi:hypothetical protein